ncbi:MULTISPECIES: hypothetical protein [Brevibacillus]|uniref:hypothetical protein n=1 Tax=Brevibacillus TaxID=55080 RepID=UPI000E2E94BD|nr:MULTISPECIES: hypothetical protein [Brevibacillus]MED1790804.1 hypothetical protein [Brevibacillus laterosporus]RFB35729.1 hypothetical protein DZB91_09560 [Brevibacillus sp. VP]
MSRFNERLRHSAKRMGQSVVYLSTTDSVRCSCWNEDFQQPDSDWHNDNPDAPLCNTEGFLVVNERQATKVFLQHFQVNSSRNIPQYAHYIEKLGPIELNDYMLIAPELPEHVKSLEWQGKVWSILNPIPVYDGDEIAYLIALVRGGSST